MSRTSETNARELKISFPGAWLTLAQTYGSGTFRDAVDPFYYFWIYNPLSPAFLRKIREICDQERESQAFHEIFPIYPEKDGVFPLGEDNNDHTFWHVTSGGPNEWPILVIERDFTSKSFQMPLTKWIGKLFSGEISIWNDPFTKRVWFHSDKPT